MKKLLLLMTFLFIVFLVACNNETEKNEASNPNDYPNEVEENPIVTITMENNEKIIAELYPKIAPNTVANFISLIEDDFYDGLIFHRVIPGFMIQGGDPEGNGTGGPGYSITGEFSSNGFENDLAHERGVLSMARSQSPDSAGSQFFIMVEDSPHLDGEYASFGKVIEGMEVVDAIVSVERDERDKPYEDQTIQSMEVDLKGYNYPEPDTQ
ncbi:peptidylprolyl isomerase [Oceanobacillus luteolus]|uniref:peptidylprolyl isomerase n=1 Tax=Oceanobacillus luteolus TaxID=1274358 RepID=UPI00203FEF45|nr:peptidylprolyl isomerase [Oceanobacillus luteolus]MCM3739839.1 peptidylprolyl isomerase [Oceanobacillus luteolus]